MQKISFNREWDFQPDESGFRWGRPPGTNWRKIDLPHDWSVEYDRSPDSPSQASNGYFIMGRGLYRKTFAAPQEWQNKRIFIEFEGVYMNAEVWINGHFLGLHPYGYTPFHYDLSPYLKYGSAENELFVMVDNSHQLNSRWYSGSGIYRPVWLCVENPVHLAWWGVAVTTPEIEPERALVRAETTVENESDGDQMVTVRTRILAADGTTVAQDEIGGTVQMMAQAVLRQELVVEVPRLWSPDEPNLYHLETDLLIDGRLMDIEVTPFGIRKIEYSAKDGFRLNGQPLLMKGGCVHHDNGVLGAASYPRSEERKVEVLKASGYNAIRCAHNPPAPAFLDACDRLGMLIIDEAFDCWREGKTTGDYHTVFDCWWQRDLETMVYRDRNHPSVVVWSIGNEVVERMKPEGAVIGRRLADTIRAIDPTRPVTAAVQFAYGSEKWEDADGLFAVLDICGYNYNWKQYAEDSQKHPERIIFGTESFPKEAFENWMAVLEMPNVIGDFVWTSLDYLGEAGIGRVLLDDEKGDFLGAYPWHQANCGDLDLCGFKRPQSYYRDILWNCGEKLYIAVRSPLPAGKKSDLTWWGWWDVWHSWNWQGHEGETLKVYVYSGYDQVELLLNGKSLGKKPSGKAEQFLAGFEVPYEPGELKAVGYVDGKPAGEKAIRTTGAPKAIRLKADRTALKAEYGDLCFVTVEIVDEEGNVVPNASNQVFFTVQGPGVIAAVGNADPLSTERYTGNTRKAHRGICLAVVKTLGETGMIRLRAQADGLDAAEVMLSALQA